MTESEWLAYADPFALMQFTQSRKTFRQHILVQVACVRSIDERLFTPSGRKVICLAEKVAEDTNLG
jgi:hypothetical protein